MAQSSNVFSTTITKEEEERRKSLKGVERLNAIIESLEAGKGVIESSPVYSVAPSSTSPLLPKYQPAAKPALAIRATGNVMTKAEAAREESLALTELKSRREEALRKQEEAAGAKTYFRALEGGGRFSPEAAAARLNRVGSKNTSPYRNAQEAAKAENFYKNQARSLANEYYTVRNEANLAKVRADETLTAAFDNAKTIQADMERIQRVAANAQNPTLARAEEQQQILLDKQYLAKKYGIDQKAIDAYAAGGVGARYTKTGYGNIWQLYEELEGKLQKVSGQLETGGVDFASLRDYQARLAAQEQAARDVERYAEAARKNPIGTSIGTVALAPYQGLETLAAILGNIGHNDQDDLENYIPLSNQDMDITRYVNAIRRTVSEEIEKSTDWDIFGVNVASFLYETGMSIADSIAGAKLFGKGQRLAAGLSRAAQDAYVNMENGLATNGQIILSAIATGAAEFVFEKFSIDRLLKPKEIGSVRDLLTNALKQAGVEASEEMATEISNILTGAAILGEQSDFSRAIAEYERQGMSEKEAKKQAYFDSIRQVVLSGLGGALSGGVMGGLWGGAGYLNRENNQGSVSTRQVMQEFRKAQQNKEAGSLPDATQNSIREQVREQVLNRNLREGQEMGTNSFAQRMATEQQRAATPEIFSLSDAEMLYYVAGRTGLPMGRAAQAIGENISSLLTVDQARQAYESGLNANASGSQEGQTAFRVANPGLVPNQESRNLNASTRRQINGLARGLGVQVEIVPAAELGEGVQGDYANGRIRVSDAAVDPVMTVVGHEFTHRMKELSSETFNDYRDYVVRAALEGEGSAAFSEDFRDILNAYVKGQDINADMELALEEFMAEWTSRNLFQDPAEIRRLCRENMNLGERILEWIQDILLALRQGSAQARLYGQTLDYGLTLEQMQRAQSLFETSLAEARRQAQSAQETRTPAQEDGEYVSSIQLNVNGKKSRTDVSERMQERIRKGYHQQGERPFRQVQVPIQDENGRRVSKTVATVMEAQATPEDILPTLDKMIAAGEFSYDPKTDKAAISRAEDLIEDKGFAMALSDWLEEARKGRRVSKDFVTLGWTLYNNAANSGNTKEAVGILTELAAAVREGAQAVQAVRILKRLSPEAKLYSVSRSVTNMQQELYDKYKEKAPNLQVNEDLVERFLATNNEAKQDEILREIYKDIGRQLPADWKEKFNNFRYLSMLLNPRTHIRNIVGNLGFAPVRGMKNLTGAGLESLFHIQDRTKAVLSKFSQADRDLMAVAKKDFEAVKEEVFATGKFNDKGKSYIDEGRKIFNSRMLERLRKLNANLLDIEDGWFLNQAYAASLAQFLKANHIRADQFHTGEGGISQARMDAARAYAMQEAKKATYRDNNAFSDFIARLGRTSRDPNFIEKGAHLLVEGALPFKRTPANILVRGAEYSPLGLAKGIWDLRQVRNGNKSAAAAIDQISSGLVGSGLFALGYFLAKAGVITGGGGQDEKKDDFDDLMGVQDYSLVLGDRTYTLDWLAPESLPFFMGVELFNDASDSDKEDVNFDSVWESIKRVTNPMLEMSMLQGLQDVLDNIQYSESKLIGAAVTASLGYLTQYVPTLFGQIERTTEGQREMTFINRNSGIPSDLQYTIGKVSGKLPFEFQQIPYIDAWGRTEESGQVISRAMDNFLNPSYSSEIKIGEIENELQRLYDSGLDNVFPTRPSTSTKINGEYLTADEYVTYAQTRGQISYSLLEKAMQKASYRNATNAEKADIVGDIYDYATAIAKMEVVPSYEENVSSWILKAADIEKEYGLPVEDYIFLRNQTADLEADKDKNGESIPLSKSKKVKKVIDKEIPDMGDEAKKAIYDAFGVSKSLWGNNSSSLPTLRLPGL